MRFDDQTTSEAFQEIAALLAAAYNRFSRIQRVPVESIPESVNKELDIRPDQSLPVNGS